MPGNAQALCYRNHRSALSELDSKDASPLKQADANYLFAELSLEVNDTIYVRSFSSHRFLLGHFDVDQQLRMCDDNVQTCRGDWTNFRNRFF